MNKDERFIDVWRKYIPAPSPREIETYNWCERFWQEGRTSIDAELVEALIEMGISIHKDCTGIEPKPADLIFVVEEAERIAAKHKAGIK